MPALMALRYPDREPLLDLLDRRADTVCISQTKNSTSISSSGTRHLAPGSLAIHTGWPGPPMIGFAGPAISQSSGGSQELDGMAPQFPPSHVPLYANTGQAVPFPRRSRQSASHGFRQRVSHSDGHDVRNNQNFPGFDIGQTMKPPGDGSGTGPWCDETGIAGTRRRSG